MFQEEHEHRDIRSLLNLNLLWFSADLLFTFFILSLT